MVLCLVYSPAWLVQTNIRRTASTRTLARQSPAGFMSSQLCLSSAAVKLLRISCALGMSFGLRRR